MSRSTNLSEASARCACAESRSARARSLQSEAGFRRISEGVPQRIRNSIPVNNRSCPTKTHRKSVFTVTAFGGFRDAVCMSAVITGQTRTLQWGHPQGVVFSDAFDVYPWFPSSRWNGHVIAFTPALKALHSVNELRLQSAPALGKRSLSPHHLDEPLLTAIVDRWERCFAAGNESVEDRRLFRALDMARAASKSPGGVDASEFDAGRSVSLWFAFETLAHDECYSDLGQVIALLNRVEWLRPTLKARDRDVSHKGNPVRTNLAGELYRRFHYARTAHSP